VHVDLDEVNVSQYADRQGPGVWSALTGEPASVPDPLIAAFERQFDLPTAASRELTKDLKPGTL